MQFLRVFHDVSAKMEGQDVSSLGTPWDYLACVIIWKTETILGLCNTSRKIPEKAQHSAPSWPLNG